MNVVYYLVSTAIKDKTVGISGGHGYSYSSQPNGNTRKLTKDTPSSYGYFVNGSLQSIAVTQEGIFNGRGLGAPTPHEAFLSHFVALVEHLKDKEVEKLLIIHNCPNGQKLLKAATLTEKFRNNELVLRAREKFKELGDRVILDDEYYVKGGEGAKQAHKQLDFAKALVEVGQLQMDVIDEMAPKEFKNPENDFNKIVTASRWYFNTGDRSTHYNVDDKGYLEYNFGRPEPAKHYYGKATPDTMYSSLFTKKPITVLDKLYDFCKERKPNPYNLLAAANVDMVKSKEISRIIDILPGTVQRNSLVAPMEIGGKEDPILVDFIDPPGLSYRIVDFHEKLRYYHTFFQMRDENNVHGKSAFVDITNLFYLTDEKGKVKIHPGFTNNTITIPIPVECPGCVKPVTINLAIKYDCPERNAFNSLINNKVVDFKVWLGLDFSNESGVRYYTIIETPEFNYIHSNASANLRVYNLKELGRS
ncbi:ribonuclease [Aeromonas phage LAh10]|uniref:Putative ribonuclease H n=1 Tax=Aeromonas phage LAh10 TaxID=2591025 RepID=A0A514A1A8_9CAUD|nr:ribonuclease [Aeromonas phage LAh10]QDH47054.1 putative ribonuclease H [Aeromonas phage LAh10]